MARFSRKKAVIFNARVKLCTIEMRSAILGNDLANSKDILLKSLDIKLVAVQYRE